MPRRRSPATDDYARVKLTHHPLWWQRGQTPSRDAATAKHPECIEIGHAWTDDPNREGGSICLACLVVRWP